MDVKLSSTLFTLFSVLTLAGCQTPSKNIALNQSTEERTFILLADIPDSDSDGVLDDIDNCPNTPKNVVVDELGCPTPVDLMDLITMDMRVFFERNSNELQSKYFPELEKVTDKMLTRPDLDLVVVLAGHISEPEALQRSVVVSGKTNQPKSKQVVGKQNQLGRDRAQLVKKYLINQGIPVSRIYSFDCANTIPVTPNDNDESASMNQRVYGKALPANDFFTGKGHGQMDSFETYKTICQQF
ncbi:hypothetical protein Psyaliredsea_08580 [Psychrobacter alimentarius]